MFRPTLLLLALLPLAGCASRNDALAPTSPPRFPQSPSANATAPAVAQSQAAPSAPDQFVDLSVGGHAQAARTFRFRIVPEGGGDPGPWTTIHDVWDQRITGTQVQGDLTYAVEELSFIEDDGNSGSETDLLREDRSGLYLYQEDVTGSSTGAWDAKVLARADRALAVQGFAPTTRVAYARALRTTLTRLRDARAGSMDTDAPIRRSGTVVQSIAPHEITILRYPLRPGASWDGRIGFNVWTVEAREPIVLLAGRFASARLRIDIPLYFGPRDRYTTWYASPGEIAHAAYLESQATDENGQPIGTIQSEDDYALTSWEPAPRR